jgi:hypothetical protein
MNRLTLDRALKNADFLSNNMLSGDKVLRIFKEPVLLAQWRPRAHRHLFG